ncbi:two-component system sensor histidine kinase FlrB [Vibrio sp. ES.051]|uniref:sensor histidine kinase n=1 Tax=Vibrio sp. ES.051 TaxID=1761909 RepID=UPI000BF799BD|nr:ATP-binding protein [Vibrio sp. ES.051]PFG55641.1 two-component system sensor histidine kinase FlrB [Vibrio sp. ES.051]
MDNNTNQSHLDSVENQVERYKQVLDVMPAGVILLDTYGVVREANPEAHRILDIPLVNEKWFNIIQAVFDPREDDGHEVSLRNGRKVRLAISASTTGQLILITDLTETRLLQARVSDLQRMSSLGHMVASLAHQVRTPLSSAMLYASNLGAPNLPTATRERFQSKLMDRLHDLEKQVNDMLLFAKGGDNKVIKSFTIAQLVAEYQPMVETALKNNSIDYFLEVEEEQTELLGNANAIASALSNLVMNAVQMSGKESQIDIFFRPINGELRISVQDSGPGVPQELQAKIMEPFFTTRSQGTGLGLAVVQMVCRAHDGRLELISEQGDGACFTMCIPLERVQAEVQ